MHNKPNIIQNMFHASFFYLFRIEQFKCALPLALPPTSDARDTLIKLFTNEEITRLEAREQDVMLQLEN